MSCVWRLENLAAGWNRSFQREDVQCSLNISVGERVALLGDSHSGVRTLFRVLAGVQPHKSGDLEVCGKTIDRRDYWEDWDNIFSDEIRRKIGVSFEEDGLLASLSIRVGLEMLFRARYGDHSEKLRRGASIVVEQITVKLGLREALEKRPVELSQAERRLAALARALISKPLAFLLENPTHGIGDLHKRRFLTQLKDLLQDSSRTLLLSTDDWKLAWALCPRWIFLEGGQIVFDGNKAQFLELRQDYKHLLKDSVEEILNPSEAA